MKTAAIALLVVVAVLHLWFFVLESFLWTTPFGRKTFRLSEQKAADTAPLAQNQGLYNAFLAAGLLFAAFRPDRDTDAGFFWQLFFTGCVVIAGLVGGFTASRSIFFVQMVPGLLALGAVVLARR